MAFLVIYTGSFAQLTGTKTIGVDYATLKLAIADLNLNGVGAGGVTFNLPGEYTETFDYPDDGLITATGTAANPIVFHKTGTGHNPKITAASPGYGSYDYIFCTGGADYITFDAIDIAENPNNSDDFSRMEYGYALFMASGTNGSQHNTIKNCNISLNKENINTNGIYSRNRLYTNPATTVTVSSLSGANSFNSFYNNNISNTYNGISIIGYPSGPSQAYAFYDQGNDIGSLGGNTITDFGGGSATISGIYTQHQNNHIVAKNSVTGAVTGTVIGNSSCCGIRVASSNNANYDIYDNYVSIQYSGAGFGGFTGIFDENSAGSNNGNTTNIYNNTITGCTLPNATTANCNYMLIWNMGTTANVHHNTITNNTYGSGATTSTGSLYYIYIGAYPQVFGTASIYSNVISNNERIQSMVGPGDNTYLYTTAQSNTINIYDNVIDNNTAASSGTTYGIENHTVSANKNIYRNTVTNIKNANGASNYGISVTSGYSYSIYNNKVQGISANGANSTIWGMYVGSVDGSSNMLLYNNYVGDLKTPNSTSLSAIVGMYLGGFNANIVGAYNNTVFLNASSTGANFGTTGIYVTEYPVAVDLKNNIVVNTSTPNGTGQTVALLTTVGNFGFPNLSTGSNNNCYFAGTPSGSNLIYSDVTKTDQTLLSYKNRVYPRELLSVTENPPFINSLTTPMDLHLGTAVATQCESGGVIVATPVAIVSDYDNDARFPNSGYPVNPSYPASAPDMGADEFGGIPLDLLAPIIEYHPLLNTSSGTARILTATITDAHGVPVSGIGIPRLAWKKFYNGTWTYVDGVPMGSNQFMFTFGGGAVLGDSIYYYVLAQDNNSIPNAGSFPFGGAGGYTVNPPNASVPPSNASSYKIITTICGTFTVGVGKDYPTITAAFNAVNSSEITCPVTLVLTDAQYGAAETFPLTLNPNNGSSPVNILTIRPQAGVSPVISGPSATDGIIKVKGFDYLVVDGSSSGGTDMNLTVRNTSATNGAYAIGLYSYGGYDPANNFTVKNSKIKAAASFTLTTYGILFDGTGVGYDNCTITQDSINNMTVGIYYTGNANYINHNGQITNNIIGSPTAGQELTNQGVFIKNCDNTLISGNEIQGMPPGVYNFFPCGVYVSTGSTNTKIRKNKIHDWYYNREDGIGANGISYNSDGSTVTEISNNVIYNIKSPGAAPGLSPNNGYGIYLNSGGNIKILHNTIYLSGNILSGDYPYSASSACIGIHPVTALINNLEIRNNILKNSQVGLNGPCSIAGKAYAIMTNANASSFININNNDYYADGCHGTLGVFVSTNYATLGQWQAFTGQDANSLQMDPVFTSPTNLVPTSTTMNNAGSYITTVPNDILGAMRSNPPDMGAYEFAVEPLLTTLPATGITVSAATLNATVNAQNTLFNTYFDYGVTEAYGSILTGNPALVSGNSNTPVVATATGLLPQTTYHFRARGITTGGITVYGNDLTFVTPSGVPEIITVTNTITNDTCFNATNTITVAGTPNTFIVAPTGIVTMIAGQNIVFLPGSVVQPGGYLHGYISTQYCGGMKAPLMAVKSSESEVPVVDIQHFARVFPNPASGTFTLELNGDVASMPVKVEIYGMTGVRVHSAEIIGERNHLFTISNFSPGIYFVHVISGEKSDIVKLIKL